MKINGNWIKLNGKMTQKNSENRMWNLKTLCKIWENWIKWLRIYKNHKNPKILYKLITWNYLILEKGSYVFDYGHGPRKLFHQRLKYLLFNLRKWRF